MLLTSFLRVGKCIIALVLILLFSVESNTVCSVVPSSSMLTNMIADIYYHHHTDGATLITDSFHQENDFQERSNQIKTQKSLSRLFIPTTMVGSSKLDESRVHVSSRRNRPLNIFLSSGPGVALTIHLMSEENWFRRARWLLFLNDSVEQFFNNTNLPVDCNVLVAHQPLASDKVILSEVYRVTRNLPLTENYYGQWCIEEGFTAFSGTYYSRRSHLQGLVLRAAALNMPPTSEVKYQHNKIQYGGYVGLVWNVIEEQMKFRTEYVLAHNMGTGSEVNGTWTGLVGMVVNNKVDVALELFSRSTERLNAIDFSSAVYYDRFSIFVRRQETKDVGWKGLLSPFNLHLWMVVLMFILTMSCYIFCIARFVFRWIPADANLKEYSIVSILHSVFGAILCSQGLHISPRTWSVRVGFLITFGVGMVLLAAYSARLIASITIKQHYLPFTSLEGLLKKETHRLGVHKDSAEYNVLKSAKNGTLQSIFTTRMTREPQDYPIDVLSGLERICGDRKYAFVTAAKLAKYYFIRVNCTIDQVPDPFMTGDGFLIFSKQNPYVRIINHYLRMMQNSGLMSKLYAKSFHALKREDSLSNTSVDVQSAAPIFTLLFIGMITGVIVLGIELGMKSLIQKQSQYHREQLAFRQ